MRLLARPVWREGMHLAQHHFQTQSKYFEDSIAFAIDQLFFRSYGVAGCELDEEALKNGTISLIHARGIMPDGLTFSVPEGDSRPPLRDIGELFSPTDQDHLLVLAIPKYLPGQKNCTLPDENQNLGLRYSSQRTNILDDTTGGDEKPVLLGIKNLTLLLDSEIEEGQTYLPIARIKRHRNGFVYDDKYIPPCLQIGASKRLTHLLTRLIERLNNKSGELLTRRQGDARAAVQYAGSDVEGYWQLHAIRSSLAPLRYYLHAQRATPEALYVELARLAGALSTFLLDATPDSMPLYNHDRLEDSFDGLEAIINEFLGSTKAPSARFISLPLRQPGRPGQFPLIRGCSIEDDRCFTRTAEWYLAVRSPAPLAQVARTVSSSLIIASAATLMELRRQARIGVAREFVETPPAAMSPRMGTAYFRLARTGSEWDAISKQKAIAMSLPDALPQPEVEVLVVFGQ